VSQESRRAPIPVPRITWLFLAAALVAASQSANIIRIGDAHPVAIAAWRLLLATFLLLPFASRARGLGSLGRRERWLLVAAGVTLALHFISWVAAVQHTTVANATLLLAVTPVLTAIGSHFLLADRVGVRLVAAIGLSSVGVVTIGWGDFHFDPDNLVGDAVAVLSAALFAGYTLFGRRLRGHIPNATYAASVYALAALICFPVLVALGEPVVDYDGRNWLCFVLMAAIPTGIGHTGLNHALKYLPASTLSVLVLTEPALAGLVAVWAWGEPITAVALVGYAFIISSVLVLLWRRWTRAPTPG
jgi:drug/metabolite transporter (DMT)-like permease